MKLHIWADSFGPVITQEYIMHKVLVHIDFYFQEGKVMLVLLYIFFLYSAFVTWHPFAAF